MAKLLIANWKMNCGLKEAIAIADGVDQYVRNNNPQVDVVICPPFIHISYLIGKYNLVFGAQNCAFADNGAYTGEVSAQMLADIGCKYVIVGHSERRQFFDKESDLIKKVEQATNYGLKVIFCVGESLDDYKANRSIEVIAKQLSIIESFDGVIIAYEPIWAIGTGLLPQNNEIENVVKQIKMITNSSVPVLYGGSVNDDNIAILNEVTNIDGYLVGGASLYAEKFNKIMTIVGKR